MKNEITIKVYEVDYSFIIKNYLDKELWSKSWTLFVYKDYIFTLNLAYINTESNSITFKIKCNYLHFDWEADVFDNSINVTHSLSNSNINVLKRQINGALFSAIENIEKIERKRFQKKLATAIEWLEFLDEYHDADDLQLDYDELKSVKDSIIFLKSPN